MGSRFEVELEVRDTSASMDLLGNFMRQWTRLETAIRIIQKKHADKGMGATRVWVSEDALSKWGILKASDAREISELRKLRNQVVHGELGPDSALDQKIIERVKRLAEIVEHEAQKQ